MRSVALLAVVVAALAASQASAAPEANLRINPGVGIGKLRLGMTKAQVRGLLGRPRVNMRRRAGFGSFVVDYEYGYAEYSIRFFGQAGLLRATRVGTTLWRERTRRGLGVATLERVLRRAYPGLRCQRLETVRSQGIVYLLDKSRTCTLFAPSGRRTIFTSTLDRNIFEWPYVLADWQRGARVAEVAVAEPR
jgi:hypothetical protein